MAEERTCPYCHKTFEVPEGRLILWYGHLQICMENKVFDKPHQHNISGMYAPDCPECLHNMLNHEELRGNCHVKGCKCKRVQASYIQWRKWLGRTKGGLS